MRPLVLAWFLLIGICLPMTAGARCYHYDNSPSELYVCVGKNRDDYADRNRGQEICTAKSGKKCGPVSSTSTSCHSNAGTCFDEGGAAHSDLSGY